MIAAAKAMRRGGDGPGPGGSACPTCGRLSEPVSSGGWWCSRCMVHWWEAHGLVLSELAPCHPDERPARRSEPWPPRVFGGVASGRVRRARLLAWVAVLLSAAAVVSQLCSTWNAPASWGWEWITRIVVPVVRHSE